MVQRYINLPDWQNKIPIISSLDRVTDFGTYFIDRSECGLWSYYDDLDSLSANFDKLYNTYMLQAGKAAKAVEYVCAMQKEYQKENDGETLVLSNDDILCIQFCRKIF